MRLLQISLVAIAILLTGLITESETGANVPPSPYIIVTERCYNGQPNCNTGYYYDVGCNTACFIEVNIYTSAAGDTINSITACADADSNGSCTGETTDNEDLHEDAVDGFINFVGNILGISYGGGSGGGGGSNDID